MSSLVLRPEVEALKKYQSYSSNVKAHLDGHLPDNQKFNETSRKIEFWFMTPRQKVFQSNELRTLYRTTEL